MVPAPTWRGERASVGVRAAAALPPASARALRSRSTVHAAAVTLRGFTAAIIGGLGSYPGAVLAALLVGVAESFSSFWASAFKEVIVFTAIIPVLLWRSLRHGHGEDEE